PAHPSPDGLRRGLDTPRTFLVAHEPRLASRRGAFLAPFTTPAGWASSRVGKPAHLFAGVRTTFGLKEGRFSSALHTPRRMGFVAGWKTRAPFAGARTTFGLQGGALF